MMVSAISESGFIIKDFIYSQTVGGNLSFAKLMTFWDSVISRHCIVWGLDFYLSVRQNSASNFFMVKCLNMGTLCLKIIYVGLSICHTFLFGHFPRIPEHFYVIFRKIFQLFRILVILSSNFMTLNQLRIIYTYTRIFHSLISCICQKIR